MAHYFFDIHDTRFSSVDEDGQECRDRDAVSEHALSILCAVARDKPLDHLHSQLGATVRDVENHVVLTATVSLSITWVGET
ncbi:DUF6894 family protein [Methylobacterium sp. J-070]|uniref:DUF6894 family protein n=1 Tax=Methylobacterium sp. J-070 TaxID=2836650 RepID=UPI00391AA670